jgi:DNA (cytosine-5)-methyltransferase 1
LGVDEDAEEPEDLFVPDRFEGLKDVGAGTLRSIIVPVDDALSAVARQFRSLTAARRGGLLLLRGDTGAGKSTFLDTIGLFLSGVSTEEIPAHADVSNVLAGLAPSDNQRVLVLGGREALGQVARDELEATLHAVNTFVRSEPGSKTLVVWPTNTDELTQQLAELGSELPDPEL